MRLYLAIFGVVLSTLVVPLPEEMALLGAGYLAQQGQVTLAGAFAVSWLAIVLGDFASWLIGRHLLHRALKTKWGERLVRPERRVWAERFVKRQGWRAVVLGRFLVALRGPVYFALGASRYPAGRFLAINSSVAVAEVALVVWLGYRFGQSGALVGKVRWIDAAVALSLALALLVPWLFSRWLRRGPRREARA